MIDRRQFVAASGGLAAALALPARAQTAAASAATRIVVGFAPGGSTDTMARVLAARLQKDAGGTVLVENKPGAGGRLAVMEVRGAAPDGRTVLLTPDPMMVIYPHAYRRLAYDPLADFRPVTPIASVPIGLAVGPMVPAGVKTMADFAQWCKANPQSAAYGSAGAGTTLHFVGVMYARAAGIAYTHVPYRGGAPAAQDVMAGQIASSINVISELVPLVPTGKLRVLAVSSPQRSRFLPDVPTFRESGFRELEAQNWFGTFVPARTPDAVLRQVEASIAEAARSAEVQESLGKLGYDVFTLPPERFAAMVKSDFERWGPIVRASGYSGRGLKHRRRLRRRRAGGARR